MIGSSGSREEERKYGLDDHSETLSQLGEKSPTRVSRRGAFRKVCEEMSLVKIEDNEWPPWTRGRIQEALRVDILAKTGSSIFHPPRHHASRVLKFRSRRGLLLMVIDELIPINEIENVVILRKV
jgi:hypothetical protein